MAVAYQAVKPLTLTGLSDSLVEPTLCLFPSKTAKCNTTIGFPGMRAVVACSGVFLWRFLRDR